MADMNFRNANAFDPETYGGQGGGLLGMLRRYMQQQSSQQQGADVGSNTDSAPDYSPETPLGEKSGLLGRMLALQAEQDRYQSGQQNGGSASIPPPDPNFRRLSRVPSPSGPQGAIGPSNRPDDQSYPVYSPFGEGASLDLLRTSQMQQNQYEPSASNRAQRSGSTMDSQRRMLAQSVLDTSQNLGIDPKDLATAISYETGGTFDPWKAGPVTHLGQHRGLIQWGEPQAKQYGVTKDSTISQQMQAVGKYLSDRGVRPGMGLLDIYSAINAGRVGLYNRSDESNGGAPGTVADKVNQMDGHRINATRLLKAYIGSQAAVPQRSFPAISPSPIRILSQRAAGDPSSLDSAQAWAVPQSTYDPRR